LGPVRIYTKIIDWIQSVNTGAKVLDLAVQIEGFYNPALNSMVPDTMRVLLRSSVNPYPVVDSAKAYLNEAGQGSFVFNNALNGTQYYIQLKHRSGLETWSKTTQSFSSNHLAYDFTSNANKAYGDNMKLSGSKWVIYVGDVVQNGSIDLTDLLLVYNAGVAFTTGYTVSDVNGNNTTDLTDLILTYNNSIAFVVKKTPLTMSSIASENINVSDNISQSPETGDAANEIKIDREIYDRFKNQQLGKNQIPDLIFKENGTGQKKLKGDNILK
jgi:hypothetical protein